MTFSGPIAAFFFLRRCLTNEKMVLELTMLEYRKKWYFPNYFWNSALLLNISKINANGPFWPFRTGSQIPTKKRIYCQTLSPIFKKKISRGVAIYKRWWAQYLEHWGSPIVNDRKVVEHHRVQIINSPILESRDFP